MSERLIKQLRLRKWAEDIFGYFTATTSRTRNLRFIEEAAELVQALGTPREDVEKVLDRVYSRPPGEPGQEIGGVMVTLYLLAEVNGLDVEAEEDKEIARIHDPALVEKLVRSQAEKKALGL